MHRQALCCFHLVAPVPAMVQFLILNFGFICPEKTYKSVLFYLDSRWGGVVVVVVLVLGAGGGAPSGTLISSESPPLFICLLSTQNLAHQLFWGAGGGLLLCLGLWASWLS